MAEIQLNGLKGNSQMTFYSDMPEEEIEIGEIDVNHLSQRRGKFI